MTANMMDSGAAWLMRQLITNASRDVIFRRGAAEIAIKAVPGRSEFPVLDASGASMLVTTQDWIVSAEDLVIDGVSILPERGDEVVETDATGVRRTFATIEQSFAQCYRLDQTRASIRIHTNLVSRSET